MNVFLFYYGFILGGITSGGVLTQAYITNNIFNFGADTITAGNGSNTVYGDLRDITWLVEKGNNQDGSFVTGGGPHNLILLNQVSFGVDTIKLGDGNNTVYGDGRNLLLQVTASQAIGGAATYPMRLLRQDHYLHPPEPHHPQKQRSLGYQA